jgi:hypothetical protein
MKKDFSPEARAASIAARKQPSFRPMTEKEIKKMESRNREVSQSDETHYEMLQRNAKSNLPSSLR